MLGFINSWAQGIILAVIIATIIEIILPEGNNKKYVKTIIGIYIMFVMVHPLISKVLNKNVNIESIIENTTNKMSKLESDSNIAIETNAYIEETYKQKLEEDIRNKSSEKGYSVNFLNLTVETEDNEEYGKIKDISMQISKIEKLADQNEEKKENITNNTVDTIQNIEIKISNTNTTNEKNNIKDENISEEEIETLKEYLKNTYGVSKEKVHINE